MMSPPQPQVGIGYRRRLHDQIVQNQASIDCLEILVEHFLPLTSARLNELSALQDQFTLIPHGVGLSIGSKSVAEYPYASDLKRLLRHISGSFFGEHLSVSRAAGLDIWHLSPVWRTREQLDLVIENILATSDYLEVPIVLETITESFSYSGAEFATDEFYVKISKASTAELLVDVTNLWINSKNGVSNMAAPPFGTLHQAPWKQLHVVGYSQDDHGRYLDSHETPIQSEIFDVLEAALVLQTPEYIIIERDGGFNEQPSIVDEVRMIKELISRVTDRTPETVSGSIR